MTTYHTAIALAITTAAASNANPTPTTPPDLAAPAQHRPPTPTSATSAPQASRQHPSTGVLSSSSFHPGLDSTAIPPTLITKPPPGLGDRHGHRRPTRRERSLRGPA